MKATLLETAKISGIEFRVGTKIEIINEGPVDLLVKNSTAEVTRVTAKSIFIKKNEETEDKMIVNRLVESYIEKKLWIVEQLPAAPVVVKEKKAKKEIIVKVPKLTNTLIIHYWANEGLTAKEIHGRFPLIPKGHISSSYSEAMHNEEWRKRSVASYLAYNAIDPIAAPLTLEPLPAIESAVAPEATPQPEKKAGKKDKKQVIEQPDFEVPTDGPKNLAEGSLDEDEF